MKSFTATIRVKEPVTLSESTYAYAIFDFNYTRETKRYYVFNVVSGMFNSIVHMPKCNFSEIRAVEFMAKNGYCIKRLNTCKQLNH